MKATEQRANLLVRTAWNAVDKALERCDAARARHAEPARSKGKRSPRKKAGEAAKGDLASAEHVLAAALDKARTEIGEATALLDKLVALEPTLERQSLYGSAMRRLALIEEVAGRPPEEQAAIESMKEHYEHAEASGVSSGSPISSIPR